MAYIVRATDLRELDMTEPNERSAVLQHVAVILSTVKGSVPLYRDFGLSEDILDLPVNVAKARLASEISEVLDKYEPRAKVLSVRFDNDKQMPGRLVPVVEVEVDE